MAPKTEDKIDEKALEAKYKELEKAILELKENQGKSALSKEFESFLMDLKSSPKKESGSELRQKNMEWLKKVRNHPTLHRRGKTEKELLIQEKDAIENGTPFFVYAEGLESRRFKIIKRLGELEEEELAEKQALEDE